MKKISLTYSSEKYIQCEKKLPKNKEVVYKNICKELKSQRKTVIIHFKLTEGIN
jgi:glycerol-3-phosphate responsive antiterminator